MNARLHNLIVEAEARLPPAEQERLADLVEAFVASSVEAEDFTREEMALLHEIAAEPFVPADPDEVSRFFRERG